MIRLNIKNAFQRMLLQKSFPITLSAHNQQLYIYVTKIDCHSLDNALIHYVKLSNKMRKRRTSLLHKSNGETGFSYSQMQNSNLFSFKFFANQCLFSIMLFIKYSKLINDQKNIKFELAIVALESFFLPNDKSLFRCVHSNQ